MPLHERPILGGRHAHPSLGMSLTWLAQELLKMQPVIGDPNDIATCHALGLNFSRAWALGELARHWAVSDRARATALLAVAWEHQRASLPFLHSGGWMADHWIGTFAVMAYEVCTQATIEISEASAEADDG